MWRRSRHGCQSLSCLPACRCAPPPRRLQPHPAQLPPRGPAPTLEGAVQCVGAGLFRLVPLNGSE